MIIRELPYRPSKEIVVLLQEQEDWVWLDCPDSMGRYEYVCFWPYHEQTYDSHEVDHYERDLSDGLKPWVNQRVDIPPFQGGVVGLWHYDAFAADQIKSSRYPCITLRWFDLLLAWDHKLMKMHLISTGRPEKNKHLQGVYATQRAEQAMQFLSQLNPSMGAWDAAHLRQVDFDQQRYEQAVRQAQQWIRSGRVFELNLTQRWVAKRPKTFDLLSCYQQLRRHQPAPMAAFWSGTPGILSFSPERFVSVDQGSVTTSPIKGTAARHVDPLMDARSKEQLRRSTKDIAENVMIVDLMRNDLAKICRPESIYVKELCLPYSFPSVHHLISTVKGTLLEQDALLGLMRALFPGGSITGAPKAKAMTLIDALEPSPRGPYTGCLAYFSHNGCMDSSILIRSVVIDDQEISYHAGGAVTLLSDPQQEYEESCLKANAIIEALSKGGEV